MHAVWGVGRLGLATGEAKYLDLAKGAWDYLLTRGTGTGWFPAGPDNCDETCCVSDMISIATLIGRSGHPEYFDYAERYLRNYISNSQFIVTPEFEAYYRKLHADKGERAVADGLEALRRFQGGIIGGHRPERLRERAARPRLRLRDVRLLRPGRDARDPHRLDGDDRPSPGVEARPRRRLRRHEPLPRLSLGRGRVVHARRGPPDGQGGRPRRLLPPPAALGPARSGAGLRRDEAGPGPLVRCPRPVRRPPRRRTHASPIR